MVCSGRGGVGVTFETPPDSPPVQLLCSFTDYCAETTLTGRAGLFSPADINYDETLSTLRFADRAKAIKTQVWGCLLY